MKLNLNKEMAYRIASDYIEKYNMTRNKVHDIERLVTFYEEFYRMEGPAWLVVVEYPGFTPGDIEETTYVVSDTKKKVEYAMDTIGTDLTPYLKAAKGKEHNDDRDIAKDDD